MTKISVLLFSRNDVNSVFEVVDEVYAFADEIILVDSSDKKQREELHSIKGKKKLSKLKIFYAIPLGIVEAYRMYALKKCRNEWILYLDTDERLSPDFKKDIGKIVDNAKYDAFNIMRYEYVVKGKLTSLFTWNIRLYKKSKVLYRGIIHEQPIVEGKLGVLDQKYYMENRVEYHNFLTGYEYARLLRLERLSYKAYNEMMLAYLGKVAMPGSTSPKDTWQGNMLQKFLRFYEGVTGKKENEELTNFDYFAYHFTKYLVFFTKQRDLNGIIHLYPNARKYVNDIQKCKEQEDGAILFQVSQIIYKEGIIEYLGLGNEKVWDSLNKRYKDGEIKGADLLVHILKEKYKKINNLR